MSELGIDSDTTAIDGVLTERFDQTAAADEAEARMREDRQRADRPKVTTEDLQAGGNDYTVVINPGWLRTGLATLSELTERHKQHVQLLTRRIEAWTEYQAVAQRFGAEDDALQQHERREGKQWARGEEQKQRRKQPELTAESVRKRERERAWNRWVGANEALADFANETIAWVERQTDELVSHVVDPERERRIRELRAELAKLEREAAEGQRVSAWLRRTAGQSPFHQGRQRVLPIDSVPLNQREAA